MGSSYEQKYFKKQAIDDKKFLICFKKTYKASLNIKGIKDYEVKGKETSFFKIRISDCSGARMSQEKYNKGLRCKTKDEIKKWRKNKMFLPITIQKTANFQSNN